MSVVAQMKKFVEPKSVALIGVSRAPASISGLMFDILGNLLDYGYQGRIYPVNPHASEILGIRTYPSIGEVADDVDLAVINLPRPLVPSTTRESVEKGISAITIVTQGFADADDVEGKQLQKEVDEIVKGKARVLGPNTFGTANAFINFSSSFVKMEMKLVPTGVICQSGVFMLGYPGLTLVGKGIDLGNGCDVDFADGLEYFEQDNDVKVVALHVEGMRDARRFLSVANRVAHSKPIVALKTGRSGLAAEAAQSHTGSVVGKDEVWEVALKQSGITRVSNIDELGDMVKAFSTLPLLKGKRIGVVTHTGACGVISIDACQKFGLQIVKPSSVAMKHLSAMSPPWLAVSNPVDTWPAIMVSKQSPTAAMAEATHAVISDVDAVLFVWLASSQQWCDEHSQLMMELASSYPDKALVSHPYGPLANEAADKLEKTGKTMAFSSPHRAARGLSHLADYSHFLGCF